MGENSTGLFDNAAKKAAEGVGNRVGNAAVDAVKKAVGEVQISAGSAYTRYLENAIKRYNRIKTIATGTQYRSIIGENALYVHVGVKYRGKEYSTLHIEKLLSIGNNLLVEGTGGAGKSMMMRYLFLDTAYAFLNRGGTLIPVLLELRRLNTQSPKDISAESLLEFVYSCMQEFDAQLDIKQVKSSLRKGKLLLLFDGFDEVPEALARKTADAIQTFCSKYPNSPCIITSRPDAYTVPLQTFSTLESMPLRKDQAVRLAGIIWDEDEKTREFCHQLDKELFEKHRDFAENPLLLTMMFLTFMRNLSIPEHLSEFYQKAYDALYSAHDNQNKGVFKREFRCKTLGEQRFTQLFAYFCFHSYFKSKYEFTQEQLLSFLKNGLEKLGFEDVSALDYLKDLQNIVCMIVQDGNIYRFSHRSFQAYFAAIYTSKLSDEEQKLWFANLLSYSSLDGNQDYYELLYQLAPERFATNALEEGLRTLQSEADKKPNPDLYFFKRIYSGVVAFFAEDRERIACTVPVDSPDYNITFLFINFITNKKCYTDRRDKLEESLLEFLSMSRWFHGAINFTELDSMSIEDKSAFYQNLTDLMCIRQVRTAIHDWLVEQDEKRRRLKASSDRNTLLENL